MAFSSLNLFAMRINQEKIVLIIFVLMFVAFSALLPNFLTSNNITLLLQSVSVLVLAAGAVAACSDDKSSTDGAAAAGATTVNVTMTDDGCTADPATVNAGPLEFKIKNASATKVTEAEILRDTTIMG